jgi:membrane associated rhomboid family serine protease
MSITIVIIIITSGISILAFNNQELFRKLQFNAYQVYHRKEIFRLLTHGFVHAGWWHLIVNMLVLYFFGRTVEYYLNLMAAQGIVKYPILIYLFFYLISIVFASSISLFRHKDNVWYNAVGASGAVAAVMFFSIFF